jgi:hypothetical protein
MKTLTCVSCQIHKWKCLCDQHPTQKSNLFRWGPNLTDDISVPALAWIGIIWYLGDTKILQKTPPSQRSETVNFDPTVPHELNFQIIEFNPTLEALWQSQTPKPCHIHLQFQGQDLQQIAPATTLHHGLGWEGNELQNVQRGWFTLDFHQPRILWNIEIITESCESWQMDA